MSEPLAIKRCEDPELKSQCRALWKRGERSAAVRLAIDAEKATKRQKIEEEKSAKVAEWDDFFSRYFVRLSPSESMESDPETKENGTVQADAYLKLYEPIKDISFSDDVKPIPVNAVFKIPAKPISTLSQRELMYLLEGVDWLIWSCLTYPPRNESFFRGVLSTLERCVWRCVSIGSHDSLPQHILDSDHYSSVAKLKPEDTQKVVIRRITENFQIDVHSYFRYTVIQIRQSMLRVTYPMGPLHDTGMMEKLITDRAKLIREEEIVRRRREYMESLHVSHAARVIHKRKFPLEDAFAPNFRDLLENKHPSIYGLIPAKKTVKEVFERDPISLDCFMNMAISSIEGLKVIFDTKIPPYLTRDPLAGWIYASLEGNFRYHSLLDAYVAMYNSHKEIRGVKLYPKLI